MKLIHPTRELPSKRIRRPRVSISQRKKMTTFQCIAIVFSLLLGALSSYALPRGPRSAIDTTNYCSVDYQPALPIFQLNHGIEATMGFTGHGIDIEEDDLSRNMTFYTTLQILSDVAMTLHNASLRNSSSIKLRALAAVVKQVVTDACSFGLSQLESEMVNCSDIDDVASFALRRYVVLAGQEETEVNSDRIALSQATTVRSLLGGIHFSSSVPESGSNAWVRALIPENVQSPICNRDQTGLHCCSQ